MKVASCIFSSPRRRLTREVQRQSVHAVTRPDHSRSVASGSLTTTETRPTAPKSRTVLIWIQVGRER